MVDTIVELAIVIELVLSVDLSAFFGEVKHRFLINHVIIYERIHFLEASILVAHG